jgi:hypothetical protein
MSAVITPKKAGRKRMEDTERRRWQKSAYFTPGEIEAVELLAGQPYPYGGESNALRAALGLLVRMKHPELLKHLRADLQEQA